MTTIRFQVLLFSRCRIGFQEMHFMFFSVKQIKSATVFWTNYCVSQLIYILFVSLKTKK